MVINFEEELAKFRPSKEVEEAEDAFVLSGKQRMKIFRSTNCYDMGSLRYLYKYIEKSGFFTLVRPQTASAYSRSEIGVVKCDDSLESGLLVVEISYLFVSISTDHFNVSHCVISIPIKQLFPH